MRRRILTAVVLLPMVLGLLWVGWWGFIGLWLGVGLLISWEYSQAVKLPLPVRVGLLGLLSGAWLGGLGLLDLRWIAGVGMGLAALWLLRMEPKRSFGGTYQVAFGLLYIGGGWGSVGWHFGKKAYEPKAVLSFLALVWIADTVAYLVGKRWGRHKVVPHLSPQKSWEGLLAGMLATAAAGHWLVPLTGDWDGVEGALVGAGVTVVGFLGDVWESAWKRYHALKDAGSLLPGHGGFLDRVDALLWVGPAWALAGQI